MSSKGSGVSDISERHPPYGLVLLAFDALAIGYEVGLSFHSTVSSRLQYGSRSTSGRSRISQRIVDRIPVGINLVGFTSPSLTEIASSTSTGIDGNYRRVLYSGL